MFNRYLFLVFLIINVFDLKSQLSLGGGVNSIAVIDIKNPYLGFNLLGEYREDDLGYFAKFYSTLPQNDSQSILFLDPIDPNEPFSYDLNITTNYRYNVLEFGKKYFFGKDLDFGFGGYLSSHFALIMNIVNAKTDKFDETRYKLPFGYSEKGKIYGIAGGVNAGAQYAFYYGTYFMDFGLNYIITAIPSKDLAQQQYMQNFSSYRQLFFVFNFGIKKTIFNTY